MFTPLETRLLVKRRLALEGSYGSCRVTGNCRPATGKTQQGQVDVCHLRQPESGQVRTHGHTRPDRFLLVGRFLCLACSHCHLTLTFLVLMYSTPARASESRSRYRVLIPACSFPVQHQSVTLVVHRLSLNIISCFSLSVVHLSQQQSVVIRLTSLSFGLLNSHFTLTTHFWEHDLESTFPDSGSLSVFMTAGRKT